ncbi:ABC transporter ATP-binding protein [Agromyces aurantiacus]|uniref:ABC transporter ATP-binding protein n=1 Tax=Agromyces aurantiacus TaxID=165814 RepID=A0ABV9R7L7_9MICO|nr:ABC transporter ATP-binding protein [Agromyces aurantiacus]MBM7504162.1 ATP-binding cassette subfamily C protein [Agromyces aurantiacus]
MKANWRLYQQVLSALPRAARRFLLWYAILQGLLAILDGAALALLAVVLSPLVGGQAVTLPILGEISGAGVLVPLAIVCLLIVLKGVLALVLYWAATRRFAAYELDLGSRVFEGFTRAPWIERLRRNSSDLVRITDSSVATTIAGFVLPGASLIGEALNFVTLLTVLAVAQPFIGAITLVYLGLVGLFLNRQISRRTRQAGLVALRYSLRSSRLITEMIAALKEVTLRGMANDVAAVVRDNRTHSTRARANAQFLGQVPRYTLETAIIVGIGIVGLVGWLTGGIAGATAAVAIFGLAGFRMAPSVVRFQGVLSQLNVSAPHAQAVVDEIQRSEALTAHLSDRESLPLPQRPSVIRFESVSFTYAPDVEQAVSEISLEIPFGSTVAFVGASGAGKSTIVDLLLGLIEPTAGRVMIDDVPLTALTEAWRRRVAYVPQEVSLFDATVAQNVALTWTGSYDAERVRTALDRAHMLDAVESRFGGIDGRIGERGMALSGGQRQRLGIARALYVDPLVLVMDEATSALDTATEAAVTQSIAELRGSTTTVTVAHRLATIKDADRIFFLSGGRLVAQGTFDELVLAVPEFATQAALAGLADRALHSRAELDEPTR